MVPFVQALGAAVDAKRMGRETAVAEIQARWNVTAVGARDLLDDWKTLHLPEAERERLRRQGGER
jgi:hypothetical protein